MAYGSIDNPFFNPTSGYGQTQDWNSTPFVKTYMDPQIPQGVYQSFLAGQGLGGFGREGQFAQQLYGKTQAGYQAALRENPTLLYHDYLGQQFGSHAIHNMWAGLAPEQRGERPSLWGSRNRVIGWG